MDAVVDEMSSVVVDVVDVVDEGTKGARSG